MATDLPKSLKKLAREAVESLLDESLPTPDLEPLHVWFEENRWDQIVMSVQGPYAYLDTIAGDLFNDESIREHSDSDDLEITDEMRVSFARGFIDSRLDQSDDFVHAVELKVPSLPAAYLDCVVIGQGQGGWSLEWGSIYKTVQELLEAYSDALVGGSASVSDEKILALWRANEKR
jgi:hypothetical protein